MKENLKPEQNLEQSLEELAQKFNTLNGHEAASSKTLEELFSKGEEGQKIILQKIFQLKNSFQKDAVLFRVAKLYYENQNEIEQALELAQAIQNPDEKARCLVQLADAVLKKEGDVESADKIVIKITQDRQGYLEYYK